MKEKNYTYDKYSPNNGSLYSSERNEFLFPEKEETMEPETRNGIIWGHPRVNIRTQPRKDSKVVTVLKEGDIVEIIRELPDWYEISIADYPGRALYVASEFCRG